MTGMSVSDTSAKAIANLGWDEVRMVHPLFVGDTLYAESEVLDKRESKSRPDQGIVTFKTVGKNQNNIIVSHFKRTVLVWKRGYGPVND
jgi:itaconyl-CoA hydratase